MHADPFLPSGRKAFEFCFVRTDHSRVTALSAAGCGDIVMFTRVISVLTLDLSEQGRYEMLAAMGVILLVVTTLVVAVGMKLLGREFMLRRT